MIPGIGQMEGEFGEDAFLELRKAMRAGGLPRLLSWLYLQDFRSDDRTLIAAVPTATPSDIALIRDNQTTGARRVLDLLAQVIGEEIKLPPPPFRKIK